MRMVPYLESEALLLSQSPNALVAMPSEENVGLDGLNHFRKPVMGGLRYFVACIA